MKGFIYFLIKIGLLFKCLFLRGKVRLGKKFHSPRSLSLCAIKESKITIGDFYLGRRNIELRAEGGNIILGNHVFINDNVYIASLGEVIIGDSTIIGPNVVIVDHDHDYKTNNSAFIVKNITIGKNVWIGANAVILKGSTIGDGAVIAAGTIVKGDVPPHSLVYQVRENHVKEIVYGKDIQ
jgi:acetyltransferase-like isoleucine patch superfamily enzyme